MARHAAAHVGVPGRVHLFGGGDRRGRRYRDAHARCGRLRPGRRGGEGSGGGGDVPHRRVGVRRARHGARRRGEIRELRVGGRECDHPPAGVRVERVRGARRTRPGGSRSSATCSRSSRSWSPSRRASIRRSPRRRSSGRRWGTWRCGGSPGCWWRSSGSVGSRVVRRHAVVGRGASPRAEARHVRRTRRSCDRARARGARRGRARRVPTRSSRGRAPSR